MGRRGHAKEAEELKRQCEGHEAVDRVETKSKHWMVFPKDKSKRCVVIPKTPSDWRSLKNCKAELRRAGIQV